MNTMKTKYVLIMLFSILCTGCTYFQKKETRLTGILAEESKALTTAVVDVLHLQPPEERDRFTATALEFATQDQRLEGLPLKPFDARGLVGVENLNSKSVETLKSYGRGDRKSVV